MDKEDILQIKRENKEKEQLAHLEAERQKEIDFETKCKDVIANLDKRLKGAAMHGYLELFLIDVTPQFVHAGKICSHYALSHNNYREFHPYQDKSVVKSRKLRELWEILEAKDLLPIFIPVSNHVQNKIVFGVQLPDEGKYPRNDSAWVIAGRIWNGHDYDYYLNEDGTFSVPGKNGTRHIILVSH
jgi:hypothetical protein